MANNELDRVSLAAELARLRHLFGFAPPEPVTPLPLQLATPLSPSEIPGGSGWGRMDSPSRIAWTSEGAVDLDEIDRRVAQTRADVRNLGPLAAGYWLNRVKPGGEWDDKVHGGKSDMSREGMGNAAFAATAKALGGPAYVARNGAGAVQFYQNLTRYLDRKPMAPSSGFPVVLPPYGDDLRGDRIVRSFYNRPKSEPLR